MARWDEILSLPVQNPPTLEFSSVDLIWTKVEGWRDNIDRVALIPFARVDDFVQGESNNSSCPTRFHVEARRRRPPEMAYKPKVDGILEYILYWCSFGPDDHRKGGIVRPSRSTYIPKKKSAGRPSTKRGCTCHFIVKRLIAEPSVALIIYNQDKHVDKKGLPCHGPQDKKAAGTRAMYAPYISEDLRLRVLSLLYVGVPVETIMQRHNESVERQGGPCNRDDLLTHRYVRIQERNIRRSKHELDPDDAVSISMWVESHQNQVFFYEDFSDSNPFVLGLQTEWQLQQMIKFGNRSLVASDSRFGMYKLKYSVHSLVVFNSDNKAIPVAWVLAPRLSSGDTVRWMRALYNRVHTKDPTWKLAGFIIDDPLADILAIREVFQCSVLICFWRLRHAWHKNLVGRCLEMEMRVAISRWLGQAVNHICTGHGTAHLFDDFIEDFVDVSNFMDYFKAVWYPRIGFWTAALKNLPLVSLETCASMEYYHNQMKLRLLNEKDSGVYQRSDWLVDKLCTKVHSYFWLDEYSRKEDFARYWKDEWSSGLTSWHKSLKIPDSDIVIEGTHARVIDREDQDRSHVVYNPGSEFAICDCSFSEMGNLCEHVLKIIKVFRDKGSVSSSISMFQFNKALTNLLRCPPHDSLFRDYAVSLAVWVQGQINGVAVAGNSRNNHDPSQQRMNENHCTSENMSSHTAGNGSTSQHEVPCSFLDLDRVPSDICGKEDGAYASCAEMDIESTHVLIENGDRMSIDAGPDAAENLCSTDDLFSNLNCFGRTSDENSHQSAQDTEPQSSNHVADNLHHDDFGTSSIPIPTVSQPSEMEDVVGGLDQIKKESVLQDNKKRPTLCLSSADNGVSTVGGQEGWAKVVRENGELEVDIASTSASLQVDSPAVNIFEATCGTEENRMELKDETQSTSQSIFSVNVKCQDGVTEGCARDSDGKEAVNMMSLSPESNLASSLNSSSSSQQLPPVECETCKANTSEEPLSDVKLNVM